MCIRDRESGLDDCLKEMGVDVTAFSDKNEKVRLFFFLYRFKTDIRRYLNSFFSKPTLENVDNFRVGDITRNGEMMRKLKNSVARGISDYASRTIQETDVYKRQLSAYDDLIKNNRKQIKLLEEAAHRLYKEWFVDLRFPGHEHTKIVDGVPEGWAKRPLSLSLIHIFL